LQGLQEILWLSLARNKLAVAKTYRTFLGGFAWEVGAFKAQSYAFVEGASSYLAHPVQFRHTSSIAVGANAFLHSGAFFAGDAANTDFHIIRNRNFSSYSDFIFVPHLKQKVASFGFFSPQLVQLMGSL